MCVCLICVLTVWASIRDPASIEDRRLFETQGLLEVLRYIQSNYSAGNMPSEAALVL